jgi:hypothetical protein
MHHPNYKFEPSIYRLWQPTQSFLTECAISKTVLARLYSLAVPKEWIEIKQFRLLLLANSRYRPQRRPAFFFRCLPRCHGSGTNSPRLPAQGRALAAITRVQTGSMFVNVRNTG